MSNWLKQLPLIAAPKIGTLNRRLDPLPDWVAFMIWCGWWLRDSILEDKRLIAVIVVPDKGCCSALCGLGALIASTQVIYVGMSWDEFKNLPEGFEIYLKDGNKNLTAKVGNLETIYGNDAKRVYPINSARYRDSSLIINENNFGDKQISMMPLANNRELPNILSLYKSIVDRFNDSWASSMITECEIVTNKAQWSREIEDVMLFSYKNQKEYSCKLSSSLFIRSGNAYCPPKISILSPRSLSKSNRHAKLTISDGSDALRQSINNMNKAGNSLFILSQREYDNSCYDYISSLTQYRCESSIAIPSELQTRVPAGVQMTIFTLQIGGNN